MSTTPPASDSASVDILVVDDCDIDAQLTLHALTHLNPPPRTLWLGDGCQALAYLMCRLREDSLQGLPSLVVTDMHMPGLSGLELLAQIRAEPRLCRLPVIMLSGQANPRELQECYRLGVDVYVEKVIGDTFISELAQAVTQCFSSVPTRDP